MIQVLSLNSDKKFTVKKGIITYVKLYYGYFWSRPTKHLLLLK